ncbi:MAG: pectinesterase family protein [Christiangramia sp.]|uniref:pectinesterase family protein n=1 Tax=Christiangramia sp. TaxID=1931228 RepID=UPI0032422451
MKLIYLKYSPPKFMVLFLLIIIAGGSYAQKKEIKPYTIQTTYEKLKKDYPFVKPIQPLEEKVFTSEEDVVYKQVNGVSLKADIFIPTIQKNEKFPAVLLVHGGGWLTGTRENLQIMAQHLAKNGFVAITASYRLGTEAAYPAAVLDLKDAVKWMRENAEHYHIAENKIAILGASAGGQLASLVGVTANDDRYQTGKKEVSDEVQAIVNIDGILSFIHPEAQESWMAATWLGGSQQDAYEKWKEASPLEYVDQNTPPTLFINSSQPRFHAGREEMIAILQQNGIYSKVHTVSGSPHAFWLLQPWFEETLKATVNFLNKTLKFAENKPYREIWVAQDGSADFKSIQEAVNSTRDLGPSEVVIHLKNGEYHEKLEIPSWKHQLTLVGEDRENTLISYNDFSGKLDSLTGRKLSTFTSASVTVKGNDIHFKNLSIQNTSCGEGQAVALHVEGDRFIAENCTILGCQDTLYTASEGSRQYYFNCYIEGTTDFIFGEATAVFENCEIHSLKNSYVTAAATPKNQDFGYVFLNCQLTAPDEVEEVYLGRPWRPYAKTVFLNTELGAHIVSEGWNAWEGDEMFPNKEDTAYYAEYHSFGKGAAPEQRVSWSHQLTDDALQEYSLEKIFRTGDSWFPKNEIEKNK